MCDCRGCEAIATQTSSEEKRDNIAAISRGLMQHLLTIIALEGALGTSKEDRIELMELVTLHFSANVHDCVERAKAGSSLDEGQHL